MFVMMFKWTEDDLRLVLCQGQRIADSIWCAVLFSACSCMFSECFGCFLWCAVQTYRGIWSLPCVWACVCWGGWWGGSLWCLILFLYVNRFKWHIFEVPTRRSVNGYIVTAHRCHCIHDCYWFSRAISHILATWKESIENLDNLIKPQDIWI